MTTEDTERSEGGLKRGGVEGAVENGAEGAGRVAFLVDFHDGGELLLFGELADLAAARGAFGADRGDGDIVEAVGELGGHGEELGTGFAEGFDVGFVAGEGGGGLVHNGGGKSKSRFDHRGAETQGGKEKRALDVHHL